LQLNEYRYKIKGLATQGVTYHKKEKTIWLRCVGRSGQVFSMLF